MARLAENRPAKIGARKSRPALELKATNDPRAAHLAKSGRLRTPIGRGTPMGGGEDRSSAERFAYPPRQIRNGPHAERFRPSGPHRQRLEGPCQPVFTSGNVHGSAAFASSTSRR
jgi:hypothetical protein